MLLNNTGDSQKGINNTGDSPIGTMIQGIPQKVHTNRSLGIIGISYQNYRVTCCGSISECRSRGSRARGLAT